MNGVTKRLQHVNQETILQLKGKYSGIRLANHAKLLQVVDLYFSHRLEWCALWKQMVYH